MFVSLFLLLGTNAFVLFAALRAAAWAQPLKTIVALATPWRKRHAFHPFMALCGIRLSRTFLIKPAICDVGLSDGAVHFNYIALVFFSIKKNTFRLRVLNYASLK